MYSIIKIDFISSDKNFNRYNTPLYREIKGYLIIFLKIFLKMNQLTGFPAFILKKCLFPEKERINAYPFFNSKNYSYCSYFKLQYIIILKSIQCTYASSKPSNSCTNHFKDFKVCHKI